MDMKIILPPTADEEDPLEFGLVALTQAIAQVDPERVAHGALGGSFGYGGEWDGAVFAMHPYCWCDRSDCPWCHNCTCPEPTWLVGGEPVSFDEWVAAYQSGREREEREHPDKCDYCLGKGVWSTHGAEPGRGAPNFWHKSSGLKVWWYKWIGRDMTVHAPDGIDLAAVFAECAAALAQGVVTEGEDPEGLRERSE